MGTRALDRDRNDQPADDPERAPSVLAESLAFLRAYKWVWIVPLVLIVAAVLALLLIDDSPIAPFIYRHY